MRRVFKSGSVVFAAVGILVVGSLPAMAQSGSRSAPPSRPRVKTAPPAGSGQRAQKQPPLALEGFCAVSILDMRKWVKGVPAHQVVYDGRTYRFANQKGKGMFQANPAKYVPALGGDCVVALVKKGKRVPGSIHHASFHEGRLFLFSIADAHKMFRAKPATYARADLALGGKCPVCRVNMGRDVPGKPAIAALHKGLRYLFPAAEQRKEFLSNSKKYVSATRQPTSGSSTRPPERSGSGGR